MFERDWLHTCREAELDTSLAGMNIRGWRILEIGAGDGYLSSLLARTAQVEAVDVAVPGGESWFDIRLYDGETLPFSDGEFDLVFSSSVIEHIPHLDRFHDEMKRVLKPGGQAIHIVPTAVWRVATMMAHYPALPALMIQQLCRERTSTPPSRKTGPAPSSAGMLSKILVAPRHGESGTAMTEAFHFTLQAWQRRMESGGWKVIRITPSGLFYSGYGLAGPRISLSNRKRLARVFGSVTAALHLKPGPSLAPNSAANSTDHP